MKLKLMLLVALALGCDFLLQAQQDFKTGYDFSETKGAKLIFKKLDNVSSKYEDFDLEANKHFLRGIILKRSEDGKKDTFFVKLWPVGKESSAGNEVQQKSFQTSNVNRNAKGDNRYIITVDAYDQLRRPHLDISFRTWQLTQVTIPLRYNLSTKKMSDEFLNANMSYTYVWGKTRFYESEFVKPRDRFFGFGGFAGLGMVKNSEDEGEVGFLYGANAIVSAFNVNFIFAYGFESAVGKKSNTRSYIGFGLAFDLFKLSGNKNGSE